MQRTIDHDLAERNIYTRHCPECGGVLTHDWHEVTSEDYVTRRTIHHHNNHKLSCPKCGRVTGYYRSVGEAMEATKGWVQ